MIETLVDRGYIIPPDEISVYRGNAADFRARYTEIASHGGKPWFGETSRDPIDFRQALTRYYISQRDPTRCCFVYFAVPEAKKGAREEKGRISLDVIKIFLADHLKLKERFTTLESIFIAPGTKLGSPAATAAIDAVPLTTLLFDYECIANPTRNVLTGLHVPLTDAEKKAYLEESKATTEQQKGLVINDPIVKNLGLSVGRVVRIYRVNHHQKIMTPFIVDYRAVKASQSTFGGKK